MNKKVTWDQHSLDMSKFKIGSSYSRDEIRTLGSLPPNPGKQENWGGIVRLNNVVLIFVTLDKVHGNDNYPYVDYFEGEDFFWETQNSNTLHSPSIKRIIEDDNNYLFIRVTSKNKGKTLPFTFAGRITPVDFNASVKPIQFQFECLDYQNNPDQPLKEIYEWKSDGKYMPSTVADPQRPKNRSNSQGYQRDQEKKDATEQCGMNVAKQYFESNGYKVEDKSMLRGIGYDYLCTKENEIVEVEVKATTGILDQVIITKNELRNARNSENTTALFVVYGIKIKYENKKIYAEGGQHKIFYNWLPQEDELTPISYWYKINNS